MTGPALADGPDRPLVTLFVMGYNQAASIATGIASAFAQTYSPLEIILSDDCSPDGTFAVMEKMAAAYRGPHRIRLNRVAEKRGRHCIHNLNSVMALAEGTLIVQHNGDDISRPHRGDRIVAAWEASGRRLKSFHSDMAVIDADGRHLRDTRSRQPLIDDPSPLNLARNSLYAVGASAAWHRSVFDVFGPLPDYSLVEDAIIPFRGALLGGVGYIPEVLVDWRIGGDSWKDDDFRFTGREILYRYRLRALRNEATNKRCFLQDLEKVGDFPGKAEVAAACRERLRVTGYLVAMAALPAALRRSLAERDPFYLRCTLKYLFDWLAIPYFDLHDRLAGRHRPVSRPDRSAGA